MHLPLGVKTGEPEGLLRPRFQTVMHPQRLVQNLGEIESGRLAPVCLGISLREPLLGFHVNLQGCPFSNRILRGNPTGNPRGS